MPSRVRAILYNDNRDELVRELLDSVQHLVETGATHVFLACNTSHVFLLPREQVFLVSIRTASLDMAFLFNVPTTRTMFDFVSILKPFSRIRSRMM